MKKLFAISILFTFYSCQQTTEQKQNVVLQKEGELIFTLKTGENKNELNTVTGMFTKDMVVDPAITFPLKLSQVELDSIVAKAKEIKLLTYPEQYVIDTTKRMAAQIPCSHFSLTIFLDGKTKTLNWEDCKFPLDDKKYAQLNDLLIFITKMIYRSPEYKASPKPRGMYL